MQEKTLKSYQEQGYRVQLVVIHEIPFDKFQLRVNRKRVVSSFDYNKALKAFRAEIIEHINTLTLDYD